MGHKLGAGHTVTDVDFTWLLCLNFEGLSCKDFLIPTVQVI